MQAVFEFLGRVLFIVSNWLVSLSLQFIEWSKALAPQVVQDAHAAGLRELLQSLLQGSARSVLEVAVFVWGYGVEAFAQAETFGPVVLPAPAEIIIGAVALAIPMGMMCAMFFGLAWLITRQAC